MSLAAVAQQGFGLVAIAVIVVLLVVAFAIDRRGPRY